eukprot:symbB.v1.2.026524.t1/scaffold2656.1/size73803/2
MLSKVWKHLPVSRLVFGLDANTHEKRADGKAHVLDFEETYRALGLHACWGEKPKLYTTFNARTYLQPQLNKAAKSTELEAKGDRNPKDFVLFTEHFKVGTVIRDNTGEGRYVEVMVFPTLQFPSDHALVAVDLLLESSGQLCLGGLGCWVHNVVGMATGLFWHQQLKHVQQGTFLYIALMTLLLLQRAPNSIPGIICGSSAVFMASSYYTFLHKFRWEQLEVSEIPAKLKLSEGAPEVPRVSGHYKQPELPPPKQKENPKLQRAATTMRVWVNTACCDVIA